MLESPPKGTTIPYTPKAGLLSSGGPRGGRGVGGPADNPLASLLNLGLGTEVGQIELPKKYVFWKM